MTIGIQPVRIATGSDDQESRLVFHDDFLVAILVQLSDQHGADAGKWFLEIGFGTIAMSNPRTFVDLAEAEAWIRAHCG